VEEKHALIIFDGVCNFCNSSVNFIIRRDKKDHFRFTPFQSETAKKILSGIKTEDANPDSVILLEDGILYFKTTAALSIAKELSGAWHLFYVFIIVPTFIRNFFYNLIARNRYKWWGKKDSCMVPSPDVRKKFL